MKNKVGEIMTRNPTALPSTASVREAARKMKEADIGAIIVENNGRIGGILTDRDIVVRCIADGGDCDETTLESACSPDLATLSPDDEIKNAVELMRKKAIRRIPVVENGHAVGIISLGDLALERDPKSALAGISAAAPNT